MWEEEQGRKMTPEERETIDRGCIGITAANLQGSGNPLSNAEGVYGTFEQAYEHMKLKNRMLDWLASILFLGSTVGSSRYVLFAKLFWSNQSEDWDERLKPDEDAYQPAPDTGEVDMSEFIEWSYPKADSAPKRRRCIQSGRNRVSIGAAPDRKQRYVLRYDDICRPGRYLV